MESAPSRPDQPREKRGLICPACGCRHLPVLYTRQQPRHVQRVRKCRHCGRRVVTREKLD